MPGLLIASAGGAAVIAGGVVGVLALSKRSSLRGELPSSCIDRRCPKSQEASIEPRVRAINNLALTADVLWVSGAAVAVVGVVLMLVDPRAEPVASAQLAPNGGSILLKF